MSEGGILCTKMPRHQVYLTLCPLSLPSAHCSAMETPTCVEPGFEFYAHMLKTTTSAAATEAAEAWNALAEEVCCAFSSVYAEDLAR